MWLRCNDTGIGVCASAPQVVAAIASSASVRSSGYAHRRATGTRDPCRAKAVTAGQGSRAARGTTWTRAISILGPGVGHDVGRRFTPLPRVVRRGGAPRPTAEVPPQTRGQSASSARHSVSGSPRRSRGQVSAKCPQRPVDRLGAIRCDLALYLFDLLSIFRSVRVSFPAPLKYSAKLRPVRAPRLGRYHEAIHFAHCHRRPLPTWAVSPADFSVAQARALRSGSL